MSNRGYLTPVDLLVTEEEYNLLSSVLLEQGSEMADDLVRRIKLQYDREARRQDRKNG